MERHDNVGEIDTRQKIANLKQALASYQSDIGDWKGIKQREYIDAGLPAPYTDEQMREYLNKRAAARAEINALEQLLADEEAPVDDDAPATDATEE